MGLTNPLHIAFLVILLLLVFGAKRLPEMGRSLGEGMRVFKDSIGGEHSHTHVDELAPRTSVVHEPVAAPVAQPVVQPVADQSPFRPVA